MNTTDKYSILVYWDYDNVPVPSKCNRTFEWIIEKILEEFNLESERIIVNVYGSESDLPRVTQVKMQLLKRSDKMNVKFTHVEKVMKNEADKYMMMDMIEDNLNYMKSKEQVRMVVMTRDADFIPTIRRIRGTDTIVYACANRLQRYECDGVLDIHHLLKESSILQEFSVMDLLSGKPMMDLFRGGVDIFDETRIRRALNLGSDRDDHYWETICNKPEFSEKLYSLYESALTLDQFLPEARIISKFEVKNIYKEVVSLMENFAIGSRIKLSQHLKKKCSEKGFPITLRKSLYLADFFLESKVFTKKGEVFYLNRKFNDQIRFTDIDTYMKMFKKSDVKLSISRAVRNEHKDINFTFTRNMLKNLTVSESKDELMENKEVRLKELLNSSDYLKLREKYRKHAVEKMRLEQIKSTENLQRKLCYQNDKFLFYSNGDCFNIKEGDWDNSEKDKKEFYHDYVSKINYDPCVYPYWSTHEWEWENTNNKVKVNKSTLNQISAKELDLFKFQRKEILKLHMELKAKDIFVDLGDNLTWVPVADMAKEREEFLEARHRLDLLSRSEHLMIAIDKARKNPELNNNGFIHQGVNLCNFFNIKMPFNVQESSDNDTSGSYNTNLKGNLRYLETETVKFGKGRIFETPLEPLGEVVPSKDCEMLYSNLVDLLPDYAKSRKNSVSIIKMILGRMEEGDYGNPGMDWDQCTFIGITHDGYRSQIKFNLNMLFLSKFPVEDGVSKMGVQFILQKLRNKTYTEVDRKSGADHTPTFVVEASCTVNGITLFASCNGATKKKASMRSSAGLMYLLSNTMGIMIDPPQHLCKG